MLSKQYLKKLFFSTLNKNNSSQLKKANLITVDLKQPLENQINQLQNAFADGCFYLKGHSLDDNNLKNKVLKQLDYFYKLPQDQKLTLGNISGNGATRGYFSIGAESGNPNLIEKKESFSFGKGQIPEKYFQESNLVAKNLFHKSLNQILFEQLIEELENTAMKLSFAVFHAINQFQNYKHIVDETSSYQSFARSFRYYPPDSKDSKNITANSLHSDWNLLTLVWANQPGFEIEKPNLSYESVMPDDDHTLIVNYGDYISSQTNGKIQSPWHRVSYPQQGTVRDSLVYFFYPSSRASPIKTPQYVNNRPLGLFVDQSSSDMKLWIPENAKNMGEVYALKWKQVGGKY